MSASKLSKLENGRLAPGIIDVERILTALNVSDEVKNKYMAAAREEATEAVAWRLYRRTGLHKQQQELKSLDNNLHTLLLYQSSLIPGLLQTPEYARSFFLRKGMSEEEAAPIIRGRVERQEILYMPQKNLKFIITESVLRWRLAEPAMMASQLDRLASLSRFQNVDMKIIPLSASQQEAAGHSFVVRDDRMVTIETAHAEIIVTDPRDVDVYIERFIRYESSTVSGNEMRAMLATIRDEYLREQETL